VQSDVKVTIGVPHISTAVACLLMKAKQKKSAKFFEHATPP
jgi:hypothetical protein